MSKDNILKFEQNADFFFTKYIKCVEKGRYLDALLSLRSAIEKDPADPEFRVSLAELYTEIGDFEESNFLLFEQLRADGSFFGDCLFGMGCNFIGLQDIDKASECFSRYLDAFPDGEYADDAQDFLDTLEDDIINPDRGELYDIAKEAEYANVNSFLFAMDKDIAELEDLHESNPEAHCISNDLAFAYICENENVKARALSERVLEEDAYNIGALCNLLTVAKIEEDEKTAQMCMQSLTHAQPASLDEEFKLVLTYCDVAEHELAYSSLKSMLTSHPYNIRLLYLYAVACIKTGRRTEAEDQLHDMLVIHPEDQVATYFLGRLAAFDGDITTFDIEYDYSLPSEEMYRRMDELGKYLNDNVEDMLNTWKSEPRFKQLLKWILTLHDPQVKTLALATLGALQEEDAKQILRRYLMRIDEPDELKHPIFASLKRNGESEPYIAYMSGKCVEVAVGMVQTKSELTANEQKLLSEMVKHTPFEHRSCLPVAVELMARYCARFEKKPVFKAVNSWAMAFVVQALLELLGDFDEEALLKAFDVTYASYDRCMKKIEDVLEESDFENLPEIRGE